MLTNDLKASRNEAALLLRLDPENLSPSDVLRCYLVASLRLVVDDASATVLDGRAPDLARLLTATETLIKLLPSETPKPASNHDADPRQVMWQIYKQMRERGELNLKPLSANEEQQAKITQLESENTRLRAALGGEDSDNITILSAITPREADITPPGELGVCHAGVRRGPDDPKPPVTIEGKATRSAPPSRPPDWDDTPSGKAWAEWRDAGGYGGGDPWANNN